MCFAPKAVQRNWRYLKLLVLCIFKLIVCLMFSVSVAWAVLSAAEHLSQYDAEIFVGKMLARPAVNFCSGNKYLRLQDDR